MPWLLSLRTQNTCDLQWRNVHHHAVIEIRSPTLRLVGFGFPGGADTAVAGCWMAVDALLDPLEFLVEQLGLLLASLPEQAVVGSAFLAGKPGFAAEVGDGIAEVGAAQLGQSLVIERVVAHQGSEGAGAPTLAAGDVPEDRTALVKRIVVSEELIVQPFL